VELVTLSDKYGNFYAPAFAIQLGGKDLVRDLLVGVTQVEADLVLGAASRFSFTVVDAYDLDSHSFKSETGADVLQLLSFGTQVDICMGYGDARSMPRVISGLITEIGTTFPESGSPELAIAGYDNSFPLTCGKNTRTWTGARDSDAVHEIASFHNLAGKINTTDEQHAQIEQNQESDLEFIKKLADRNHFELFVDEQRTLHFHAPHDKADAVVRLAWGEGLLSFKPEANLAGQICKVEVRGWDRNKKETILGTASAGDESGRDGKGRSAADLLAKQFVRDPSKQPVLRLRQPVFTQSEANDRAKAALDERAKKFLTGDAESLGLPEVRPDCTVLLDNLGSPFSRTYYVQQATHKVDGSGYRTHFKVKETVL
jgi:phage protein D